jgi:hypothetical protein
MCIYNSISRQQLFGSPYSTYRACNNQSAAAQEGDRKRKLVWEGEEWVDAVPGCYLWGIILHGGCNVEC